jgi:predicted alpha/beta hydrolase family esterase
MNPMNPMNPTMPASSADSAAQPILLLPGWQNSVPTHWLSRWELLYGDHRVLQHDWMHPLRGDWIARLEEVLLAQTQPCYLVAHSLGCMLVAAWAAVSRNTHLVRGAFLVAPGDPQCDLLVNVLHSWSPPAMEKIPFPSTLLASHDDPYCSFARASAFAAAWGCNLIDYGHSGHINADSNLGDWADGRRLLAQLQKNTATANTTTNTANSAAPHVPHHQQQPEQPPRNA